jgi:phage tail sheath gpL-like
MASVQKLKANATKDAVWETEGELAATGSVIDMSGLIGGLNTIALGGDGETGVTLGATMTISPEGAAESGFLTITVAGTPYQIPIYAE